MAAARDGIWGDYAVYEAMTSNNAFERSGEQWSRAVLALNGPLGGLGWALCQAAQRNR
jgi:hypothetical protein